MLLSLKTIIDNCNIKGIESISMLIE